MQMEVTLKVGCEGIEQGFIFGPAQMPSCAVAGLPAAGLLEDTILPELRLTHMWIHLPLARAPTSTQGMWIHLPLARAPTSTQGHKGKVKGSTPLKLARRCQDPSRPLPSLGARREQAPLGHISPGMRMAVSAAVKGCWGWGSPRAMLL